MVSFYFAYMPTFNRIPFKFRGKIEKDDTDVQAQNLKLDMDSSDSRSNIRLEPNLAVNTRPMVAHDFDENERVNTKKSWDRDDGSNISKHAATGWHKQGKVQLALNPFSNLATMSKNKKRIRSKET